MADKEQSLKFKQKLFVPPQAVYETFTSASALCEWLCDVAQAEARPGGRLYMWFNSGYYTCGEFIRLEPGERLSFSWHGRGEPGITQVKISLKACEEGTQLTLTHSGLGGGKPWKAALKDIKQGWSRALENLKSVLENGEDLRFVRRPLLGVSGLEELGAEEAARLELPGDGGLRIMGVLPDYGAQQAGLQSGDTIVKFAGQPVNSYGDLGRLLRGCRAGDQVKLVFYRDGERQRAKLQLSQRPLPEIPVTAHELAEAAGKIHEAVIGEWKAVLRDVSDAQAEYRLQPGAWSIKEILAHLIASERETHSWFAGLIDGQDADFAFHANSPVRVAAIISAFPTLSNLLAELKRNLAETLAMVAGLPEEFVARKRSYWRLAYQELTAQQHFDDHLAQVKANLAAALEMTADEERPATGDAPTTTED